MPDPDLGYQERTTYVVIWDRDGEDDFGQPRVSDTPVEHLVRWKDVTREVAGPNDSKIAIDVELVLNRDVAPGAAVWRGRLEDLSGTDPQPPDTIKRVVTFNKTPDAKGRAFRRTATLARLKDTLPTQTS
jgi:hypothetical protein